MPNYENFKLFRILGNETIQIDTQEKRGARSQPAAYLVPFRMLSVSGFKFPFSNPARIREAIKLQTLSYSGGNAIQIFPVPVSKSPKETSGFSFFLPDNELTELEGVMGDSGSPIFPAPLALASAVGGNGITVWSDARNICSVLWRAGVPELYRWRENKNGKDAAPAGKESSALRAEIGWLKKYCVSKEMEEQNEVFIFDAELESEDFFPILRKTFESFPWLREINLSRRAINSVMILEKFARYASKAALWLAIFGVVFAAGAWANYVTLSEALSGVRGSAEGMYREVFGAEGRIVDPVRQAIDKISALRGSGAAGKTLGDVLSDLGGPLRDKTLNIKLDLMSYNAQEANLLGSAPDMATIQNFRTALAERAGNVQQGDVQQIPGGGFRFNLRIMWE